MSPLPKPQTELYAEIGGAGARLALVHGFTQTRACWGPIAADLIRDHEVVLIDAPGHGRSAHHRTDLSTGGQLIVERAEAATYLGYSMGGRFLLNTALKRADLVKGLVLIGVTAGLESADERAVRRQTDEARATRIESIGVEAFLDEWLALPLFAGLSEEAACRDERLENTTAGLASSLRLAGTGTQIPTWDQLSTLSMPVLIVAGSLDTKFVALGQRMAKSIGTNATFVSIKDAGHTAHLEQPERFLAALRSWLAEHNL